MKPLFLVALLASAFSAAYAVCLPSSGVLLASLARYSEPMSVQPSAVWHSALQVHSGVGALHALVSHDWLDPAVC